MALRVERCLVRCGLNSAASKVDASKPKQLADVCFLPKALGRALTALSRQSHLRDDRR